MDDVSKSILNIRKLDKIRNTFIKNMIIDKSVNGRIHCSFNPMGTVTGRFSSQYPNLQQVPARDPELGPMIRSLFIPEEDSEWYCADYSQQEPRVLVHYASLKDMRTAIKVQDEFCKNDKTDFHQMVANMAGIERKQAKTINLGLFYGMGNKKLAGQLGLEQDQAYELFNQYHNKVPFVKELSRQVSNVAGSRGYIKTLLGRRCRFNKWEINKYNPGVLNKAMTKIEAEEASVEDQFETEKKRQKYKLQLEEITEEEIRKKIKMKVMKMKMMKIKVKMSMMMMKKVSHDDGYFVMKVIL